MENASEIFSLYKFRKSFVFLAKLKAHFYPSHRALFRSEAKFTDIWGICVTLSNPPFIPHCVIFRRTFNITFWMEFYSSWVAVKRYKNIRLCYTRHFFSFFYLSALSLYSFSQKALSYYDNFRTLWQCHSFLKFCMGS